MIKKYKIKNGNVKKGKEGRLDYKMERNVVDKYKIEIQKAPKGESGYIAHIPKLGCYGDGDTPEEAMDEVKNVALDLIEMALEDGVTLPEGDYLDENEYSGKLSLRIPKFLHKELAIAAEKEDCSINQLIQSYISICIGKRYGERKIIININGNINKSEQVQGKINNNWSNDFYKKPYKLAQ